ncbi:TVP38/TMEM64 family protein [Cohaesibacter intestini]|uniref:TVP38/TMEM64 family protein n=1 Tax=Cohaesibacter intestini TaxID=2211145 RepID=UPI000DE8F62A|nr:TVP38/TMEM64 family protein [Cohaesibacter intestini]
MTDARLTSDHKRKSMPKRHKEPFVKGQMLRLAVVFFLLLIIVLVFTSETGKSLLEFFDKDAIGGLVQKVGHWGPLLIVGMMATAVVFSPLPSAPIAVAAGAAYGHIGGTVSVVLGASLGAVIAFLLARWLGQDFVRKWSVLPDRHFLQPSQRALMLTVIAARLIPFVSFDAVSYAAGLTKLSLFNFSVATVLGLMPMSFFLAHIGDQWVTTEGNDLMSWVFVAGAFSLLPAAGYAVKWLQDRRSSQNG